MKYLFVSWLFFFCLSPAFARDPFAPPTLSCPGAVTPLAPWQLQGMIGQKNHYLGWLRSAQGERVAIASDRPSPFVDWPIEAFMPFHVTFSAPQGCMPQRVTLQIKGKYHEDRSRAAVAAERRRQGQ